MQQLVISISYISFLTLQGEKCVVFFCLFLFKVISIYYSYLVLDKLLWGHISLSNRQSIAELELIFTLFAFSQGGGANKLANYVSNIKGVKIAS